MMKKQNQVITLTKSAALKLQTIKKKEGKKDWFLKFKLEAGHCGGGFGYVLDFFSNLDTQDKPFDSNGVKVYIPKENLHHLTGAKISYAGKKSNPYSDGLLKQGFFIKNPHEKGPCSCACNKGFRF